MSNPNGKFLRGKRGRDRVKEAAFSKTYLENAQRTLRSINAKVDREKRRLEAKGLTNSTSLEQLLHNQKVAAKEVEALTSVVNYKCMRKGVLRR